MELPILMVFLCLVLGMSAWSPYYPGHAAQRIPHRFIRHVRHARPPPSLALQPIRVLSSVRDSEEQRQRPKRDHDFDHDHDHGYGNDHSHERTRGVTGPIHTFVKTDKNANYKWGVRHHVGNKYAS